eukprot:augustus_masked-scaffold_2-processed-gene-13.50-mRNA-1 protein AED:0.35 eAED:0.45 QI:0/-1/0/1/-1/1/1/0/1170
MFEKRKEVHKEDRCLQGLVKGLEKDISIRVFEDRAGPHRIKGTQPCYQGELPLKFKFLTFGSDFVKIKGERVFPYSAEKCFNLVRDYLNFLSVTLKFKEKEGNDAGVINFRCCPQWEKNVPNNISFNGAGSQFRYSLVEEGKVFSLVEEVTLCDDSMTDHNGNKVFRFAVKFSDLLSRPILPSKDNEYLMVFSTFNNDQSKCHLKWTQQLRTPYSMGFSYGNSFKGRLEVEMDRKMDAINHLLNRKYSPRLPKFDSKVLIVGAGPSGLHMAHLLIRKGLPVENISILEKTDRYGGKTLSIKDKSSTQVDCPSFTKDGWLIYGDRSKDEMTKNGPPVYHELGTCYLSPAYFACRKFLRELQDLNPSALPDITQEVGPDSYAIETNDLPEGEAVSLDEWIYREFLKQKSVANYFHKDSVISRALFYGNVLAAKKKYCKLHKELLGTYSFTVPPKPSVEKIRLLMAPFSVFLEKNSLQVLSPLVSYAMTAQGYGLVTETSTYWAMCWLTPELLDGYFEWNEIFKLLKTTGSLGEMIYSRIKNVFRLTGKCLQEFDTPRKGMLVAGWHSIWKRLLMVNNLESQVKLNTRIQSINRSKVLGCDKSTVIYTQGKKKYEETFDFVVIAAPMSDAYLDSSKQTLPIELTELEKELFLDQSIKASKFRTNLFKPKFNGNFEKDHLRIFSDSLLPESPAEPLRTGGQGHVFAVRDSYKAIQPALSTENGDRSDPRKDVPREKMSYQYCAPSSGIAEEDLEKKQTLFFDQEKKDLGDFNSIEVLHSKSWTYFTHFSGNSFLRGNLWKVLDIQGENNTFFVHASNNFESVLDIVNYNTMVFDGLTGQLNTIQKPDSDSKPEECQRPEQFLSYFGTYQATRILLFLINSFLLLLFTVYYVLSYPIAEMYTLKRTRWGMHFSFNTPMLGNPSDMDIKKFIQVSPAVRGFEKYMKGEPSGLPKAPLPKDYDFDPNGFSRKTGPGDHIFKIFNAPKYNLKELYSKIPRYPDIDYSMTLNLTDFRNCIRIWLSAVEIEFLSFLTPEMVELVRGFGEYLPNLYSYLMSWILVTQIRCLVGYSYRFEDAKGGGVRVPNCKFLKQAIDMYGREAGQRVCLTVCKITTEESMLMRGLKMDFQPDFTSSKPGNGCTVRLSQNREVAFSDHSLFETRNLREEKKFEKFSTFDW